MVDHNRSERLCDCCGSIGLSWSESQIKELRRRIRESNDSPSANPKIDPPTGKAINLIEIVAEEESGLPPSPTALSDGVVPLSDPEVSSGLPQVD